MNKAYWIYETFSEPITIIIYVHCCNQPCYEGTIRVTPQLRTKESARCKICNKDLFTTLERSTLICCARLGGIPAVSTYFDELGFTKL